MVAAPLILAGILFFVFVRFVYPRRTQPAPAGVEARSVRYTVPREPSAEGVATDLARLHVVDSPFLFAAYLRTIDADEALRVGETVELPFATTPEQLARRLATGLGAIVQRVTLPEGYDLVDVATRLADTGLGSKDAILRAAEDPALARELGLPGPTLEGYLFPDTYELRDDLDVHELLEALVDNFRARTEPVFERYSDEMASLRADLGFDERDVLILASIVEKEAAVADERRRIAGVFLNRLRSPTFLPRQRLQSDPTVAYGCRIEPDASPSCAGFGGSITRAMLEDASNRFNTYRHGGLTPTPIANPGAAAIEAVLTAERHDYFYFVARGGRRHSFSTTLEEHNAAVDDSRERGALP